MDANRENFGRRLLRLRDQANRLNDDLSNFRNDNLYTLTRRVDELENELDNLNQYTLRDTLILSNVPELEGENLRDLVIGFFMEKLNILVTHRHIKRVSRSYDVLPPDSISPIVIEFLDSGIKNCILRNRYLLHGTVITITESLTKRRLRLMEEAKAAFGHRNVWTTRGRIVVMGHNGQKYYVTGPEDLANIP